MLCPFDPMLCPSRSGLVRIWLSSLSGVISRLSVGLYTLQVVVAIDDSRSMAENGCGSFALEAVTLICRAMARLEVGEMGVVSYGGSNSILPLHPLEKPFTDADGPGIMAQMRFSQVRSSPSSSYCAMHCSIVIWMLCWALLGGGPEVSSPAHGDSLFQVHQEWAQNKCYAALLLVWSDLDFRQEAWGLAKV